MSFLQEAMPLLSLQTAGLWDPAEICLLRSHFEVLGGALASTMQFALAHAAEAGSVGQLQAQSPGMLDLAGANVSAGRDCLRAAVSCRHRG